MDDDKLSSASSVNKIIADFKVLKDFTAFPIIYRSAIEAFYKKICNSTPLKKKLNFDDFAHFIRRSGSYGEMLLSISHKKYKHHYPELKLLLMSIFALLITRSSAAKKTEIKELSKKHDAPSLQFLSNTPHLHKLAKYDVQSLEKEEARMYLACMVCEWLKNDEGEYEPKVGKYLKHEWDEDEKVEKFVEEIAKLMKISIHYLVFEEGMQWRVANGASRGDIFMMIDGYNFPVRHKDLEIIIYFNKPQYIYSDSMSYAVSLKYDAAIKEDTLKDFFQFEVGQPECKYLTDIKITFEQY